MRRLVMVLAALVAAATTLVMADSAADAGTVRWTYINSDQKSPLLVGMPLSRAVSFAKHHRIRLDVLRVFEEAPQSTITEEPWGLPGPVLLVVSKGPPASLWAVLPGAKGPPVHKECAPGFGVDEDGNGSPATCDRNRVNVATWDYFAPRHPPVYSLGRDVTRCEVAAVYDDDHLNQTWNYTVYVMAKAYYGWTFGQEFTDQLVNAGPYADNCKRLAESDDG
jgi:hypothetical protein